MRLFHRFLALFLLSALGPLTLAGWRISSETERSLREAALQAQGALAERAAESVRAYFDGARDMLTVALDNRGPDGSRRAALESLLNGYPPFMDAAVYDRSFREISRLGRFGRGAEPLLKNGEELRRDLAEMGFHLADPEGLGGPRPSIVVCVPLDAGPAAVAAAKVNLLDLNARLSTLDLGTGGAADLTDAQGRVIASSSPGTRGEAGGTLTVRAPVRGSAWTVVYRQPSEVVFRVLRRVRRRILAALLLAGGLAALLGWLTTRRFEKPLGEFQSALEAMKSGRFDARITTDSPDELDSVARGLREAQRALEKKVRQATVGLMAHRVGHDLRQPLTAVRNSLEVVRRHAAGADATAQKHFDLIEEEVRRELENVEELLTLGRERAPLLKKTDLNALVKSLLTGPFRPGLEVKTSLAADLPACPLDEALARRAVANVLNNAVEAIEGDGKIVVETLRVDGAAALRVTDSGPGFPPAVLERLFDEFFTTKPGGTGLGMGIVKKVMDVHGGAVSARNAPGAGAVVELRFPLGRS
jgi:signal transduction histidine kinase